MHIAVRTTPISHLRVFRFSVSIYTINTIDYLDHTSWLSAAVHVRSRRYGANLNMIGIFYGNGIKVLWFLKTTVVLKMQLAKSDTKHF